MGRSVLRLALVLAVAAAPWLAMASDLTDVVAVVQAQNDAGNKAERTRYGSYCTQDVVFVDHVPPYIFRGPTACLDEYDAVVAWGAANKADVGEMVQKVLDPVFFEIHGDHAYAVFPVQARFKQNGRENLEKAYLTTLLRREAKVWRIEGLAYSSLGWSPSKHRRR